jgi:hypothetical protein
MWLPARVVAVHNSDTGQPISAASVTVRYIMTTDDFKRAQSETDTREFLPKPRVSGKTPSEAGMIAVKHFLSEEEVCGYVFDLMDDEGSGVVTPDVLATRLSAVDMKQVIDSSAALSVLVRGVGGEGERGGWSGGVSLVEMIREVFPGGGGVSKFEFVELCSLMQSVSVPSE